MKKLLRGLWLLIPVLTLAACGGGGSDLPIVETPIDDEEIIDESVSVTVRLMGLVYDEELANAGVGVYIGDDDEPIAVGTSDANGQYTIEVSVDEGRTDEVCRIHAKRGAASLATLPGTVQTLADAADEAGVVSGQSMALINVTNVSTAQLALILAHSGGHLPTDQAGVEAARAELQNSQEAVLEIAAAIKLIIDQGVALPEGIADTQALATAIAAGEATDFLDEHAAAIERTVESISADPVLAEQMLVEQVVSAEQLAGSSYAVGQDTLIMFGEDGVLTLFDHDLIAGDSGDTGSWTLAYPELSMHFSDGEGAHQAVLTIASGNANAIRGHLVFDGADEGEQLLRRVLSDEAVIDAHMNTIAFSTSTGMSLQMPAACEGKATDIALIRTSDGPSRMICEMNHGAFLMTPESLVGQEGIEPVLVILPLSGTDIGGAAVMNQALWRKGITIVDGHAVQDEESETFYRRLRVAVDRELPADGALSMRIDTSGLLTISETYEDGGRYSRIHRMRYDPLTQDEEKITVVRELTRVSLNDVDVVKGVLVQPNHPDNITYVHRLTGGTADQIGYSGQLFSTDGGQTLSSTARVDYPLTAISEADVSGKSFDVHDLVYEGDATITFHVDGTGVYTELGDTEGDTETDGSEADPESGSSAVAEPMATDGTSAMDVPFSWKIDGTLTITVDDEGETEVITLYKARLDLGAGHLLVGGFSDDDVLGMSLSERP